MQAWGALFNAITAIINMAKKTKTTAIEGVPQLVTNKEDSFEILRGVGVPKHWRAGHTLYPFAGLDIDDGFVVDSSRSRSVASAARTYGRAHSQKFVVRRSDDLDGKHVCVRTE